LSYERVHFIFVSHFIFPVFLMFRSHLLAAL
jgi:hypothetical protein